VRGYIGATIQNLTPEIADSLGLKGRKGALVAEVTPGGPSERAGLKSGDVVLALNGRPLASSSDLTRRVAQAREGDVIRLEVWRDRRTRTVEVRAARRPADLDQGPGPAAPDIALGLTVAPLDPLLRERYGLKAGQTGVVVTAVAPGSEAAEKGLRAGDVIDRVGERSILTPQDLKQAVEEARREGRPAVLARVTRQGRSLFVPLKIAGS
jgi:serine protease Do